MKHRENSIYEKLRSRAGESISETLVALLISSLALVMLAAMITSTSRVVKQSKLKMDDYYQACSLLEDFSASAGEGGPEVSSGDAVIQISLTGSTLSIRDKVQYRATDELGRTVAAYEFTDHAPQAAPDAGD